jgi:trigger factor
LKIEKQTLEDNQVKLIVEVEPDHFEKSKRQAARKISKETKIPGFRPGKAPYDVIRRMLGEDTIVKEAVELLMDEVYPMALKEAEIEPYGPGKLDEIPSMEPVTFSFTVPLPPQVELGDYRSIRESYEPEELDEKEVDQFLERIRYNYATIHPAERPAEENDLVFVTITGRLVNPGEGEEPVVVDGRPLQVTIQPDEKKPETEWPFPGFARELVGLSAGDEKTITHSYGDDDKIDETFRGKEIEFSVQIQSVKNLQVPELDDEFAQSMGEFENVEALRNAIRSNMESSKQDEYDRDFFTRVLDQVQGTANIKYPPQALEEESQEVLKNIERDLARQKMDLETYLKYREQDRDTFIEQEIKPSAKKRLERSLIIEEIARQEEIKFKNDEFEESYTQTLAELQMTEDFENYRKKVSPDRLANAIAMEAASRLMNRRVFDRLKAIATGRGDEEVLDNEEGISQETPELDTEEAAPDPENPSLENPSSETSLSE